MYRVCVVVWAYCEYCPMGFCYENGRRGCVMPASGHLCVTASLVSESLCGEEGDRSMDAIWTPLVYLGMVWSAAPVSTQDSSR